MTVAVLASASRLLAQGTVNFSAYVSGVLKIEVYAPQTGSIGAIFETTGNSPADIPSGTTVYTSYPIGGASAGSGSSGYFNGTSFSAELYAGAGSGLPFSALQPVSQYMATFYTIAAGAGLFKPVFPANDPGIPGTSAGTATLSLVVWYNGGGGVLSLAAAEASFDPYGWSTPFTLTGLGGIGSPPSLPPNLTGLTSFSLISPVPEPGTLALAFIGAAAFIARSSRRRPG